VHVPEQHSTEALHGPKPGEMQLHTAPPLLASGVGVNATRGFPPSLTGAPILFPPIATQTLG
jgi:hypothetical protein